MCFKITTATKLVIFKVAEWQSWSLLWKVGDETVHSTWRVSNGESCFVAPDLGSGVARTMVTNKVHLYQCFVWIMFKWLRPCVKDYSKATVSIPSNGSFELFILQTNILYIRPSQILLAACISRADSSGWHLNIPRNVPKHPPTRPFLVSDLECHEQRHNWSLSCSIQYFKCI